MGHSPAPAVTRASWTRPPTGSRSGRCRGPGSGPSVSVRKNLSMSGFLIQRISGTTVSVPRSSPGIRSSSRRSSDMGRARHASTASSLMMSPRASQSASARSLARLRSWHREFARDLEREKLPEQQVTEEVAAAPAVGLFDLALQPRVVERAQRLEWSPRLAFIPGGTTARQGASGSPLRGPVSWSPSWRGAPGPS